MLGSWWADTWVCPLHGFSVLDSYLKNVGGSSTSAGHASAVIERRWWPFRANTRFAPTRVLGFWWANTRFAPYTGSRFLVGEHEVRPYTGSWLGILTPDS